MITLGTDFERYNSVLSSAEQRAGRVDTGDLPKSLEPATRRLGLGCSSSFEARYLRTFEVLFRSYG